MPLKYRTWTCSNDSNPIPNKDAVKAQTAPIPTGYFAQSIPDRENASGRGAALSNKKYGIIKVSVAETHKYAMQQISRENTIANGIFFWGLMASSPVVAMASKPTKA